MTEPRRSPLLDAMKAAGGVTGDYHGQQLIRHFGDPSAEYSAATEGVAVFDRSHRARFAVRGRAPRQMLNGVLTGTLPTSSAPVKASGEGVRGGADTYHAVLTPKGKMITDLWASLPGNEETGGFLLDVPVAGAGPLREHLAKVLPPRLAALEDISDRTATITLVGPRAAEIASRTALGLRVEAHELGALAEGEWRSASSGAAAPAGDAVRVVREGDVWPEAYTVVGPAGSVVALWHAVVGEGARPAGLGVWSTLRVEAGRPAFGTDMDGGTIPVEAGIEGRAIDSTKGCYTGQEVIVRIRDRGHVNRHLRQLRLGNIPAPAAGTELFAPGDESGRVLGTITSAVESPRFGGVVALAYVRRGVDAVMVGGREVALT